MVDTGFKGPGSAVNVTASDQTSGAIWNGTAGYGGGGPGSPAPSALATRNNQWGAAFYIGAPTITPFLYVSGFDFSAIPDGAQIDGIEVEFSVYRENNGNCRFNKVFLTTDGSTLLGSEQSGGYASQTNWSTDNTSGVGTVRTFGGAANTWGATLTPANVKASNFGVAMQARGTTTDESGGYVDEFAVKVYYSIPDVIVSRTGTISASASLSGHAGAIVPTSGQISASLALSGVAARVLGSPGTISAGLAMAASVASVLGRTGTVSASASLSGISIAFAAARGAIAAGLTLAGHGAALKGATGTITAFASLSGAGAAIRPSHGTVSASASLAGRAAAITGARGQITAALTITGTAGSVAMSIGRITAALTMSGHSNIAVPAVIPPWMIIEIYERGPATIEVGEQGSNMVEI